MCIRDSNKALSSYDFAELRRNVEAVYDCPVVAVLPLSEDVARLQSADIFSLRFPAHSFSRGVADIAAAIEAAA